VRDLAFSLSFFANVLYISSKDSLVFLLSGFCSPDAIEPFTEETKKHLLSKCQGKETDFVRAVEQIVEVYEKLNIERQEENKNAIDELYVNIFMDQY
jgi:hypothetical protein